MKANVLERGKGRGRGGGSGVRQIPASEGMVGVNRRSRGRSGMGEWRKPFRMEGMKNRRRKKE